MLDIGAGPGFATADLAEVVGETGEVRGLERSARFVAAAERRCRERGLANARIEESDLMSDAFPATSFDAVWCRWVACVVSSLSSLVTSVAGTLKPGGVAIFHEYGDYASWRLMPRRPALDLFVAAVMASSREAGGDPDVGLALPTGASGIRIPRPSGPSACICRAADGFRLAMAVDLPESRCCSSARTWTTERYRCPSAR